MRIVAVMLSAVLSLAACSASGLKKAEEATFLAGQTSPLGTLIHLPFFIASSIAEIGSGKETQVVGNPADPNQREKGDDPAPATPDEVPAKDKGPAL